MQGLDSPDFLTSIRVKQSFLFGFRNQSARNKRDSCVWVERTERAKFWFQILTDLKSRGVEDILIACVDGLKGFPETIVSVFPNVQVQLCIVPMVRNSLKWISYKQKKELVIDLKAIYKSPSAEDPQVKPLVDAK
ncbi:transposase, mutator-like family protein [Leptospira alexanderi serovar Manhao 3 str. L 60]|uniref:Mutator family transposase n=1 Tax=Leptospira alexanderi serovar Manhao 3 str. L 60 TaxID=1049759 RepID=V6HTE0_9LEPT|nr:transposase, mutator-like family protein [Leptospira alexanderi serovar Manhao 3 str. L 60]